ncbi:hypothetical protein BGZ50_001839 [Haplosporangium sp. Z 11]|nr:hypothetical protein BGZ50_001839 [Haplosporangium sp. Z 11]
MNQQPSHQQTPSSGTAGAEPPLAPVLNMSQTTSNPLALQDQFNGEVFSVNDSVFGKEIVLDSDKIIFLDLHEDALLSGLYPSVPQTTEDLYLPQQHQQHEQSQQPQQLQPSYFPQLQQHQQMMLDQQLLQFQQLQQAPILQHHLPSQQQQPQDFLSQPQQQQSQYECAYEYDAESFARLQQQLQQQNPSLLYQNNFMEPEALDFAQYRSPAAFGHLSSPEGSVSQVSDQGFFDMTTTDDECYSTGVAGDLLAQPFDSLGVSCAAASAAAAVAHNIRVPASRARKATSQLPNNQDLLPASYTTSIPALSSPLKQHFSGSFSEDNSDTPTDDEKYLPKRKKRVQKSVKTKVTVKPKGPRLILRCEYEGCNVTCSSQPSLLRHAQGHKWRGLYSPVRCEACETALSNEFSVQRHILRSPEGSLCKRMRVYSIMKSETEIENTVRFYPDRPHGKKTVKITYDRVRGMGQNIIWNGSDSSQAASSYGRRARINPQIRFMPFTIQQQAQRRGTPKLDISSAMRGPGDPYLTDEPGPFLRETVRTSSSGNPPVAAVQQMSVQASVPTSQVIWSPNGTARTSQAIRLTTQVQQHHAFQEIRPSVPVLRHPAYQTTQNAANANSSVSFYGPLVPPMHIINALTDRNQGPINKQYNFGLTDYQQCGTAYGNIAPVYRMNGNPHVAANHPPITPSQQQSVNVSSSNNYMHARGRSSTPQCTFTRSDAPSPSTCRSSTSPLPEVFPRKENRPTRRVSERIRNRAQQREDARQVPYPPPARMSKNLKAVSKGLPAPSKSSSLNPVQRPSPAQCIMGRKGYLVYKSKAPSRTTGRYFCEGCPRNNAFEFDTDAQLRRHSLKHLYSGRVKRYHCVGCMDEGKFDRLDALQRHMCNGERYKICLKRGLYAEFDPDGNQIGGSRPIPDSWQENRKRTLKKHGR